MLPVAARVCYSCTCLSYFWLVLYGCVPLVADRFVGCGLVTIILASELLLWCLVAKNRANCSGLWWFVVLWTVFGAIMNRVEEVSFLSTRGSEIV